jgi:glycosyltransferase involved in cell wall biosynthesis
VRIAVWHNLPSGGGKRALHDQIRALVARGHTVEVWCPSTADAAYLPTDDVAPHHVHPLRWQDVHAGSGLVEAARWAAGGWRRNLAALERHCRVCAAEIDGAGFDVLLAHSSAFLAVAPIARFVRCPRVLYLQEPTRVLYEAMPAWPWVRTPLSPALLARPRELVWRIGERVRIRYLEALAREEAANVAAYQRVLANSLFSRESMLRAYGVSARVCYLGVDTGRFVDRGLERADAVVGVGSFTPAKNVEFVVRAVGRIAPPRPRLVWIGNASTPGYLERLRALAASLGVELDARTLVTEEALVEALNRASVMAYAPRLEPFGYVPLEAGACGLPVVAVAEGGVRETVVDGVTGLLVDGDEGEMARAIDRLRRDPALRRELARNGARAVAERWSIAAATDRLEAHLREVAGAAR